MVAAQIFNQRHDEEVPAIYGAVTTGTNWKFIKLSAQTIAIDLSDYYIKEVDNILGILATPLREAIDGRSG